MMRKALNSLLIAAVFMFFSFEALAQDSQPAEAELASDQILSEETTQAPQALAGLNPNDIPSVLFTFWEHTAIKDARRSRGMVRPPSEAELARELRSKQDELRVKPPPEERDITLGGIVYVRSNDWTIWLNGKRITPDALPEEIIDLKVYNEYIELKWFDDWTNQIFPIRLRAHQRFNIDSRIFLPG